jgi:hypothetical protein
MARNGYWFWRDNFCSIKKFFFIKKYFAQILKEIKGLKENSRYDNINAVFDGLYCAIRNIDGNFNNGIKMPKTLKRFLLSHPCLFSYLLEADFRSITIEVFKRLKSRCYGRAAQNV